MNLGDDYEVLYLGSGASMQFAMVPYNLMKVGGKAAYLDTGTWAAGAIKEAKKTRNSRRSRFFKGRKLFFHS